MRQGRGKRGVSPHVAVVFYRRPVYVGTHEFLEQQFNAPAYCNVCRKLLRGLVRQGRACTKCGVIVHDGCKEKLLFACKTTHMEFLPESEVFGLAKL
jgi:hypothetical protein